MRGYRNAARLGLPDLIVVKPIPPPRLGHRRPSFCPM